MLVNQKMKQTVVATVVEIQIPQRMPV